MKTLLVPVDFSEVTEPMLDQAEALARAYHSRVWILHCVAESPPIGAVGEIPTFIPIPETSLSDRFPEEFQRLEALVAREQARGIDAERVLRSGSVIDAILSTADQTSADLIILGSHGHGALYELVVGTVTQSVLRRSPRPVLVVPSRGRWVTDSERTEPTTTRVV